MLAEAPLLLVSDGAPEGAFLCGEGCSLKFEYLEIAEEKIADRDSKIRGRSEGSPRGHLTVAAATALRAAFGSPLAPLGCDKGWSTNGRDLPANQDQSSLIKPNPA